MRSLGLVGESVERESTGKMDRTRVLRFTQIQREADRRLIAEAAKQQVISEQKIYEWHFDAS